MMDDSVDKSLHFFILSPTFIKTSWESSDEYSRSNRGGATIYRSFGEFRRANSYCMVLKTNCRVLLAPCHDEFRRPRSDYVRQAALATAATTTTTFFSKKGVCSDPYFRKS
ncbi:hypothetical protein TNCV_3002131 [Trichonephila clavipes]|nr:hypothetical protein TNCV_3002131 [Trichonephila clavipes]